MSRTRCSSTVPALMASAWSSSDSPSRTEPSAARAMSGQRFVLGRAALVGDDLLEVLDQHRHLDAAQIEALAARQHGEGNLAHLGGGEDELHVLRRLLQRLQQRVERALGEHVHLVDEVHLVARHQRLVARALDDLAHVVDAGVGGGVHLQHVGVAAFHDLGAVAAELGHVEGRLVDAFALVVEGAREDARGGGLADAAHAGQHVALGDAIGGERVLERRHHGVLADQALEGGRAVLARQHDIRGGLAGRLAAALAVTRALIGCRFLLRHACPTSVPAPAALHVAEPHGRALSRGIAAVMRMQVGSISAREWELMCAAICPVFQPAAAAPRE